MTASAKKEKLSVKACVGCGFCCRKTPCSVATRIWGKGLEKCPVLIWDGKRYWCDLCRKPGQIGIEYRQELAAGEGCCCGLNTDRQNIPPPENEIQLYHLQPETAILIRCIAHQFCSPDVMYLALIEAERHYKLGPEFKKAALAILRDNTPSFMSDFMGRY